MLLFSSLFARVTGSVSFEAPVTTVSAEGLISADSVIIVDVTRAALPAETVTYLTSVDIAAGEAGGT